MRSDAFCAIFLMLQTLLENTNFCPKLRIFSTLNTNFSFQRLAALHSVYLHTSLGVFDWQAMKPQANYSENRDAVFPTFVGIPTFSDVPTFLGFFCWCIVCVTTMRVNWWLSGQFWLRKSSSFKGLCPLGPPPGRWPWTPLGALHPDPRSHDTFLLFLTVLVASLCETC